MTSKVEREGGRACIEGLEAAKWGGYSEQQDTVMGAMSAIMQLLGNEGATYHFLAGVSGSAFRIQLSQPKWSLASPYATNGYNCANEAAQAMGYELTWYKAEKEDAAAAQRRREAIVESIDRGYPVLYSAAECSVIVGYEDGGETFLLRQTGAKDEGYKPLTKEWTWQEAGVLVPGKAEDRGRTVRNSLAQAVRLARTESFGEFASGFRAYELWIGQLEDDARFAGLKERDGGPFRNACYVNGYVSCILDAQRHSAEKYLRSIAGEFEGETAQHLNNAAEHYKKVWSTMEKKRDSLPEPWNLFPWDLDKGEKWGNEMRHAQAAVLREMLALEKQAIAEIEKALAAMGAEAPADDGQRLIELDELPTIRKDARFPRWALVEAYLSATGYPIRVDERRGHWEHMRAYKFYFSSVWFDDGTGILCRTNPTSICRDAGVDAHWMFNKSFEESWSYIRSEIAAGRPVCVPGIVPEDRMFLIVGAKVEEGKPQVKVMDEKGDVFWSPVAQVGGHKDNWVAGLYEAEDGHIEGGWIRRPVLLGKPSSYGPVYDPASPSYTRRLVREAVEHTRSPGVRINEAPDEAGVFDLFGGYYVAGLAGMKMWRDRFAQLDDGDIARMTAHKNFPHKCYNHHVGCLLADGRRLMARELRARADHLGPQAKAHILAAADHYDGVSAAGEKWLKLFYGQGSDWDDVEALWQYSDKTFPDADKRKEGVTVIEEIIDAEEKAISFLEGALSTLGVNREGSRTWIEPIPRFPWKVARVDENGEVVAREGEKCDNLLAAFRMLGHDIPFELAAAASGEAFRFAFEENWCHDAEYITTVDALASACDILGFDYTCLKNRPLDETLAAVEKAVDEGKPVLAGLDERFWRLVVGYDKQRGKYHFIGGASWAGWEPHRAKVGDKVSPFLEIEECKTMDIPAEDWYSCYYGPEQVARNTVFIVGDRKPVRTDEAVSKTLRLAVELCRPKRIERAKLDVREAGTTPPMKYFWCAWPGHYYTGTDAIREWAAAVDGLKEPTHNFGIIHANDTTLGMQLRRLPWAVGFLEWAAGRSQGEVREHIQAARAALAEAAKVDWGMLCRYTCDAKTPEQMRKFIKDHPGLVYIVEKEQRPLLGDLAGRSRRCAWGLSLLPDQKAFEIAKKDAVANLKKIADLRDRAASELAKALGMTKEQPEELPRAADDGVDAF